VALGLDFSRRPGNYFAHSLVLDDVATDLAGSLPADLWKWPFWQSEPGEADQLPLVKQPLLAPLRSGTELDLGHQARYGPLADDRGQFLARLAAAADESLSGGPQILLIGLTSTEVWRWISAVSCLLGPRISAGMSFCTYTHDPVRAGTHLVGYVSTRPVGATQSTGFSVFDMRHGGSDEYGAGDAGVSVEAVEGDTAAPDRSQRRACASMLAEAGMALAQRAWETATQLTQSEPSDLASWYPILACALIAAGWRLDGSHLATAIDWLAAHQPDRNVSHAILAGAVGQPLALLSAERQAALVESALQHAAGAGAEGDEIAADIEELLVEQSLAAMLAGDQEADVTRIRTRRGIARAESESQRLLVQVGVEQALRILIWTAKTGVTIQSDLVRRAGSDAVAQVLLDSLDIDTLKAASSQWPELRAGIVQRLGVLPGDLLTRAASLLGNDTLEPGDFTGAVEFGEQWISIQARAGGKPPVEELVAICDLRRAAGLPYLPDGALLTQLSLNRDWTASEALTVSEAFPAEELSRSLVAKLLIKTFLLGPTAEEPQRSCWARLAGRLATWPEDEQSVLRVSDAVEVVQTWKAVHHVTRGGKDADGTISDLMHYYASAPSVVRLYLATELPELILRHHSMPDQILPFCPQAVLNKVCDVSLRLLLEVPHDLALAAVLFACRNELLRYKDRQVAASQLEKQVLIPMADVWSRKEIAAIAEKAEDIQGPLGRDFSRWIGGYRKSGRFGRRS